MKTYTPLVIIVALVAALRAYAIVIPPGYELDSIDKGKPYFRITKIYSPRAFREAALTGVQLNLMQVWTYYIQRKENPGNPNCTVCAKIRLGSEVVQLNQSTVHNVANWPAIENTLQDPQYSAPIFL